jgi:transcriptional regulator with XRE-family HTH domain
LRLSFGTGRLPFQMTPESQHMLNVLRSAIRLLGYTFTDVAAKLGVGSGYLSRLFAGKIELKFDHVVSIARAIGFEPEEILHLAYPAPRRAPSKAAARYRELVSSTEPSRALALRLGASADAVDPGDLEAAVARALQKLLAPPPPRSVEEDVEQVVERTLRKFFGHLAQDQAKVE